MASAGLEQNRKFIRVRAALKLPVPYLIGHLECLWRGPHATGNPIIGDSADIEAAAEWIGEAGKLFEALRDAGGSQGAGFIEEVPGRPGLWQIHDLWENAPEYVVKRERMRRLRAETARELNGNVPHECEDVPHECGNVPATRQAKPSPPSQARQAKPTRQAYPPTPPSPSAAAEEKAKIVAEMHAHGISASATQEISDKPNVSHAMIAAILADFKGGPGAMVKELRMRQFRDDDTLMRTDWVKIAKRVISIGDSETGGSVNLSSTEVVWQNGEGERRRPFKAIPARDIRLRKP